MQLWFKGVPQLLEIGREPVKIVCDLEHCVSFLKELASRDLLFLDTEVNQRFSKIPQSISTDTPERKESMFMGFCHLAAKPKAGSIQTSQ